LTRQNDPPSRPAKMSCHGNTPNPHANMTRQIHEPKIPPSPLKIPRQDTTCQPPPPLPPRLRQRSRGRGWGAGPARLRILYRYFCFPLHVYIFSQDITYTHSI
jgi:hypothetical protein